MNRRNFLVSTLALGPFLNTGTAHGPPKHSFGIAHSQESRLLFKIDRDADVFIDGVMTLTVKADNPTARGVYPGTHLIRIVTKDGAYAWAGRVTVQPGMQELVEARLVPTDVRIGIPGEFIDPRDQNRYQTVTINRVTWMAENLRYRAPQSWCYGNRNDLEPRYGRLYHGWALPSAVPQGWRLPKKQEVEDLFALYGSTIYVDLLPGGRSNFSATFGGMGLMGVRGEIVPEDCEGLDIWGSYFFDHPPTPDPRGRRAMAGWSFTVNSRTKSVSMGGRPLMSAQFAHLQSVRLVKV